MESLLQKDIPTNQIDCKICGDNGDEKTDAEAVPGFENHQFLYDS